MSFNRRDLLTGIAASAAVISTRKSWSMGRNTPSLTRLNVVFHGLFVFVIRDGDILALTPNVHKHSYCYLGRGGYERMAGKYHLEGVSPKNATKPNPEEASNAVLTAQNCGFKVGDVSDENSACSFYLPFPTGAKGMSPLRGVPASAVTVKGTYVPKGTATFPLVQVFSYDIDPANPTPLILRSEGNPAYSWQPYPGSGATIENLHLFAEPSKNVSDSHAKAAFAAMVKMINPNIRDLRITRKAGAAAPPPDPSTNIDGLAPEEENCLQERNQAPAGMPEGGIRIVNCMSLIIE